jgi:hypothetical protein
MKPEFLPLGKSQKKGVQKERERKGEREREQEWDTP